MATAEQDLTGLPVGVECPSCEEGPCRYTITAEALDKKTVTVVADCIGCVMRDVPEDQRTLTLRRRQEGP